MAELADNEITVVAELHDPNPDSVDLSEAESPVAASSGTLLITINGLQRDIDKYSLSYLKKPGWHKRFAKEFKSFTERRIALAATAVVRRDVINQGRLALIGLQLDRMMTNALKVADESDLLIPERSSLASLRSQDELGSSSTPLGGSPDRTSFPPRPTAEGAFNFLSDVIGVRAASEANMPANPTSNPGEHPRSSHPTWE